MSVHVRLDQFEGPLGLLLYLIRKEEMDIYNIPIHRITEQYLDHIKLMKELDLDVAGDFVAMASTLIHIKSRMLLPQYNEQGEEVVTEDPRRELVQKLLEYQKFQEVSKRLYERPLLGRDTWTRGSRESLEDPEEEIIVEDRGLFALISTYRSLVKKLKKRVHTVYAKGQSIASRIMEIKDRLLPGVRVELRELITAAEMSRTKLLITFLSVLELGRLGFVSVFQNEPYSDLWVEAKQNIERDVVARVQEYETQNPEATAEALMQEAQAEMDFDAHHAQDPTDVLEEVMASDEELLMAEQELGIAEASVGTVEPVARFEDPGLQSDLSAVSMPEVSELADPLAMDINSSRDELISETVVAPPTLGDLNADDDLLADDVVSANDDESLAMSAVEESPAEVTGSSHTPDLETAGIEIFEENPTDGFLTADADVTDSAQDTSAAQDTPEITPSSDDIKDLT